MASNEPDGVGDILFTPQQQAAYIRSLYQAVLAFAGTAVTSYLYADLDLTQAIVVGIVPFLVAIGWRGAVEGGYDAGRAERGDVKASDVGAYTEPLKK